MNTTDKGAIKLQECSVERAMTFGDYFIKEGEIGLEIEGKMEFRQIEKEFNPGMWTKKDEI